MLSAAAARSPLRSAACKTAAGTSSIPTCPGSSRTSPRGSPAKPPVWGPAPRSWSAGCCSVGFPPRPRWWGGRRRRRRRMKGWRRRRRIGCWASRTADWSVAGQWRCSSRSCRIPCPSEVFELFYKNISCLEFTMTIL